MKGWSLVYEDFQPRQERLREALCTLGNGYFATRGAAPEAAANEVHYPGTYVAGCYNRLKSDIEGAPVQNEDLVNLPNWLPLNFRIADGKWFDLGEVELLAYRQELDLRQGLLLRRVRFSDHEGRRTELASRRLVHMSRPHLAALELTLTAENWSDRITVRSALDGRLFNAGVERYQGLSNRHLKPLEAEAIGEETIYLKVQTSQSEVRAAQAARTRVFKDGRLLEVERKAIRDPGYVEHEFEVDVAQGRPITVEKVVTLYTSRDPAISECGLEAQTALARAVGFEELLRSHAQTWERLWRTFDIGLEEEKRGENGQASTAILRLHVFHLLQTASLNSMDLDVGVPARGLHGEAYRGHVFWDELFVFPFFNLRMPQITRALLQYRYRRLDEARQAARRAGYRGAMYPWQSGSNGREESQTLHLNPRSGKWVPDHSRLQRHVNAAIAYNVWQHYQVTEDMEFLCFQGAEMILEIARFWASIATYNESLDRYEILGVMGPDEYHDGYPDANEPGLDNNAYTNLMAVWVLCRALEVLDLLPRDRGHELRQMLRLDDEEIERWDEISRKMRVVFHGDGIISQFEGYDRLQEFDWTGYRERYGDIQRLDRILEAEGDSPNRYKVSKQADVLMLFYLSSSEELGALFQRLGYPFEPEQIPQNIEYYSQRTSHGSTLSAVVHSWVLSRLDRTRSWRLFIQALKSDIADIQGGTTGEGIHLGAMAGSVDLLQRCYTGIETRGDVLWLNPCLPEELRRLRLHIRYRRQSLALEMTKNRLKVSSVGGMAGGIRLGLKDRVHELAANETKQFSL